MIPSNYHEKPKKNKINKQQQQTYIQKNPKTIASLFEKLLALKPRHLLDCFLFSMFHAI